MDKYQEYLEIMNLNQNYSIDELKNNYKTLIKKYHPDKYEGNELRELAEEKLKKVNEAYSFLKERLENSYSNQSMQEEEFMYKTFEIISFNLKNEIQPLLDQIYEHIDSTFNKELDFKELDFEYLTEIYSIISRKLINLFEDSLSMISVIREVDLIFYHQNIIEIERGIKELYGSERGDAFFSLLRNNGIEINREDYLLIIFFKYNLFVENVIDLTTEMRNKFLNFEEAIGLGSIDRIYTAKTLLWNIKIFLDDFNNRVLYSFGKIFYILNSFNYIKETLQNMNFINEVKIENYFEISNRVLSLEEETINFNKVIEKFDNFVKNDYSIQAVKELRYDIFSKNAGGLPDILGKKIDEMSLRILKEFLNDIVENSLKKEFENCNKEIRYEFERNQSKRDFINTYLKATKVSNELIEFICFRLSKIEKIESYFYDRIRENIHNYFYRNNLNDKEKIGDRLSIEKEISNIDKTIIQYIEEVLFLTSDTDPFYKYSKIKIEYFRNPNKIKTDPYIRFGLLREDVNRTPKFSKYDLEKLTELFPNETEANLFIKLYIEINYLKNLEIIKTILKEIAEIPEKKLLNNRYVKLLFERLDLYFIIGVSRSIPRFLRYIKLLVNSESRNEVLYELKKGQDLYLQAREPEELFNYRSIIQKKIWGEEGGYKIKYFLERIFIENNKEGTSYQNQIGLKRIFSTSEIEEITKFIDECENEEKKIEEYYEQIGKKVYENKEMKKVVNAANFILLNLYDKPFSFEKEYQNIKNEDNKEILEEKLKKFKDYHEKVRDFKEIIKYGKFENEDLNTVLNQLKQRVKKSEISKMKQGILISHEQENISRLIRDLNEKRKNDKDEKIEMKIEILNKVVDYYSILKSI